MPVDVLFENLADGLSIDEIVESYPSLNKADVVTCLAGGDAHTMPTRIGDFPR